MKPRILIIYYSFTKQTFRVADAMRQQFEKAGCSVDFCQIDFVDSKYRIELPFKPVIRSLLRWCLPQLTRRRGAVHVPDEITNSHYDLVCIGSPTWWFHPAMPVTSFLKTPTARQLLNGKRFATFAVCRKLWWNNLRIVKNLGTRNGGEFVDSASFCFKGGEIKSALSCWGYFNYGESRDRVWGIRVFEFGVPEEGLQKARDFARRLADSTTSFVERVNANGGFFN